MKCGQKRIKKQELRFHPILRIKRNKDGIINMTIKRSSIVLVAAFILAAIALLLPPAAPAQDWFKTGTGLGVEKARLAVPEFAARTPAAQPLEKTFHDVLWNDLDYSGIIELVSPSMYPLQVPTAPGELKAADWSQAPASAYMIAFGNLTASGNDLAVEGYLYDVRNPTAPAALEKRYHGATSDADARRIAHQFADEIIARLTGGVPGIASTQIAYVSARSGNKEIWLMDYDGANQHQMSHLRSISLTPRWSPDASRIAFTCYEGFRGIITAQICLLSTASGNTIAFPRFHGTNASPAWSPDGTKLCLHVQHHGRPRAIHHGRERRPLKAPHLFRRCGYFPGLESENGSDDCVCQRSRRHAATLLDECGWIKREQAGSPGHGLRHRSRVVSQRTIAGLQLAQARRELRYLRDGYRHSGAGRADQAMPGEMSAPVGLPTAGTSCSNPRGRAPGRFGRCSRMAAMLVN